MALNQSVESSSVWGNVQNYGPQRMTDSDRRAIDPYCASTNRETQPWFRIDLQYVHQIDHMIVYTGKG